MVANGGQPGFAELESSVGAAGAAVAFDAAPHHDIAGCRPGSSCRPSGAHEQHAAVAEPDVGDLHNHRRAGQQDASRAQNSGHTGTKVRMAVHLTGDRSPTFPFSRGGLGRCSLFAC
jgi:hypothetical protein